MKKNKAFLGYTSLNHQNWVQSWSQLMTLLFALFVFLFSIALKDQKKIQDFWHQMQNSLLQVGAWDLFGDPMKIEKETNQQPESSARLLPIAPDLPDLYSKAGENAALIRLIPEEIRRLRVRYEEVLKSRSSTIEVQSNDHFIILSSAVNDAFQNEAWEIKKEFIDAMRALGNASEEGLDHRSLKIRVVVCARESLSEMEASLWQWGAARASALAQLLQVSATHSKLTFEVAVTPESGQPSRLELWVGGKLREYDSDH